MTISDQGLWLVIELVRFVGLWVDTQQYFRNVEKMPKGRSEPDRVPFSAISFSLVGVCRTRKGRWIRA